MTTPDAIAFAVCLLVGLPSMLKNWTAAALVASFLILQGLWAASQWGLIRGPIPLEIFLLCDFIVVTTIFLKGPPIEREPSDSLSGVAWAAWLELSRSDKIILAIFVPCWAAYVALTGNAQYWTLWSLGLSQFFVSGAESFAVWRRGRSSNTSEAHPADWFLRQRWAGHGW